MPTNPPPNNGPDNRPEETPERNQSPESPLSDNSLPEETLPEDSLSENYPTEDTESAAYLEETRSERQRAFSWFWFGTFIGSAFSAVGLALTAWGWVYIQDDLSPRLSLLLTNFLERPVNLGDVENVTFGSITVGPSTLGESAEDPTTVEADSVTVEFDLFETIFKRKLGLDLTISDAQGVLAQAPEKGWLNVFIPEVEETEDDDNRLEISVDDVRVENSQLTLVPLPFEGNPESEMSLPIPLDNVAGQLNIDKIVVAGEETRRYRFEIEGRPLDGGEITLKGEVQPVEIVASVNDDDANNKAEALDSEEENLPIATNLVIGADEAPLADIVAFTLSSIKTQTDEVSIESGKVSGTMEMDFRPNEDIEYSGAIVLVDGAVDTDILPLTVENIDGTTTFKNSEWTIDRLTGDYGEIDAIAQGTLNFDNPSGNGYDLTASTRNVTVEEFSNTIDLELPVPTTGNFDAIARVSGPITDPQFSGTATAQSPLTVDKVTFTDASTDFLLQGTQLFLSDIAATPTSGGFLGGTGQVQLTSGSPFTFQLAGRNLAAADIAALYGFEPGFQIGTIAAEATVIGQSGVVATTVDWDAPNAQYPGSGTIDITNGTDLAFSNTVFAIGGGLVSGSGSLVNGLWDSDVTFQDVQLSAFSEDLRGDVNGQFQFSGTTADTSIGAIAANGNITFSDGVAAFNQQFASFNSPLGAQVAWDGSKIQIIQAESNRITASGTLTPTFDDGFTGLDRLDLDITAQDYALAELPFDLPDIITLQGRTDVSGTLAGSPTAPSFNGNIRLNDLVANNIPFSSVLTGTVAYTPTNGLDLNVAEDVAGGSDAIALNVGPVSPGTIPALNFDIGWRGAFARGRTQGDLLTAEARDFPLAALNFPADGFADIGQLRGNLTANNVVANLSSQTLAGDFTVDQLGVGYISAGQLAGQVNYVNQIATLTGGQLTLGEGLSEDVYDVTGRLSLQDTVPSYSANIATRQGDVQNILSALSIYRLEDFRRGLAPPDWLRDPLTQADLDAILATANTGADTLATQLDRLAEIQALEEERAIAQAAAPLPTLEELNGNFAGNFQLSGSGNDFSLDFDLAGNNWQWGEDFSAQDVIAKGTLTPNVLTLEPVRFASTIAVPVTASDNGNASNTESSNAQSLETDTNNPNNAFPVALAVQPVEAFVNLAGQLVYGRDTQLQSNLQTDISNINIALLSEVLQLPLDIEGLTNATATLSGTLANPQFRGSGGLTNAAINDTPIQTANIGFLYQNARLSLLSSLVANTPAQPLTLTANIPYAFEFMDVTPDSDELKININVQNEGLALLNIFTDQVAWESGVGQIALVIDGTLSNPVISGNASLTDAKLSAAVLPDPLTNVNGSATFAGDQIIIDNLQGQFSNGQLTAAGTFPLLTPVLPGAQVATLATAFTTSESSTSESSTDDSPETEAPSSDSPTESPAEVDINPLFPQPLAAARPLTVNLENIALTLENDLYSGGVNGQIVVGGSALGSGPQIGGRVLLSQGEVLLPESGSSEFVDSNAEEATEEISELPDRPNQSAEPTFISQRTKQNNADSNASNNGGITPVFRDLELTLGDSIRIVQGNLLNFVADGTILINGSPKDIEPEGIIRLRSGRVNLFNTTVFRLRGNNNTAIFTPETGLQNPFLDVALRASVQEVDSTGLVAASNTSFARAEIADTSNNGFDNPGSIRTIRVRANVKGPAQDILENIELSSSPPRDQSELIALIGGGFVTALESTVDSLSGGGDGFEGLINLVGGALLTNIQDLIGNTLSVSEFRLFPVTAASRNSVDSNDEASGLDIATEVGVDITEDASATILKIITDNSNPEFGLNYRLTDSLTLRANTNLDDINQVLLEYELRF